MIIPEPFPQIADTLVRIFFVIAGVATILRVVISTIRTFVLPRGAQDKLSRAIFLVLRKLFNVAMSRVTTYEERDRIMAMYAPTGLVLLPLIMLLLVLVGFTLIYLALGVGTLEESIKLSGSSIMTLGIASHPSLGIDALMFLEAAMGLVLVALLIAYLPTIYAAFSKREMLVTMLEVRAGSPPNPLEMFIRVNRLRNLSALHDIWVTWEVWFAEVEETHTSLGTLAFFRSPTHSRSWITAAGTIMDSAALYLSALDVQPDPNAALCLRAGYICLRHIADFFNIQYDRDPSPTDPISIRREEFDWLLDELEAGQVKVKQDRDQAWADYAGWRVNYDTVLLSLAALTVAPYAPWISDRSARLPAGRRALNPWISGFMRYGASLQNENRTEQIARRRA